MVPATGRNTALTARTSYARDGLSVRAWELPVDGAGQFRAGEG